MSADNPKRPTQHANNELSKGWYPSEDLPDGPGKAMAYWDGTQITDRKRRTSYGGFGVRLISGLIDLIVLILPVAAALNYFIKDYFVFPQSIKLSERIELHQTSIIIYGVGGILIMVLVPVLFVYFLGRTPGMFAVRQIIVGHDGYSVAGSRATVFTLFILGIICVLILPLFFISFICCMWDPKKQTLIDKGAGCYWVTKNTEYVD